MPTISAIINTRNEDTNIRYCLESVKWCNEIIVVDMESEDRTVAIAREYTDKIYTHEKVLAFDIARKFAVEKATGDWVLLIDADELVPKTLSDKLSEITRRDDTDVVYIPFKTYIMGVWITHTGWWPDYHPRFFRRGSIEFVETVHAFMRVKESARTIHLSKEEVNAIEHFAYYDSTHFITKLNRYTTIEAQHLYDNNIHFSLYRMVAQSCKEFFFRFFIYKGYKDSYRGIFLSVMMAFYRSLSYMKLWEKWQNRDTSVERKYAELKINILKKYSKDT
jgi:glycosyltransferase involved in cell wall biosynthesis